MSQEMEIFSSQYLSDLFPSQDLAKVESQIASEAANFFEMINSQDLTSQQSKNQSQNGNKKNQNGSSNSQKDLIIQLLKAEKINSSSRKSCDATTNKKLDSNKVPIFNTISSQKFNNAPQYIHSNITKNNNVNQLNLSYSATNSDIVQKNLKKRDLNILNNNMNNCLSNTMLNVSEAKKIQLYNYLNNYTPCQDTSLALMNAQPNCMNLINQNSVQSKSKRLRTSSISSTCASSPLYESDFSNDGYNEHVTVKNDKTKTSSSTKQLRRLFTVIEERAVIDGNNQQPNKNGGQFSRGYTGNMTYDQNNNFDDADINSASSSDRSTSRLDKKERNRLAAQKLRSKRRLEKMTLFQQVEALEKDISRKRLQVSMLENEISLYRNKLTNIIKTGK